jgi:small subunit ribosomal protein S19e
MDGPKGIDRLSTEYGGKKRGSTRYRVAKAGTSSGSKKIIRTILQQLEEEEMVTTVKGEGRRITPEGQSFLDSVAGEVLESLDRPELERYA